MAGSDSRVGDRQSASMRIKLKYPDVETFIQKYAVNISRGGIFIATKQPKPVGTFVKFEFLLSDAQSSSIIRGEGQVQWTKEFDAANPSRAHGMGVKFTRLDGASQAVIDRALKWRAEHGTNPRAPVPVPTSSAHTIATSTQADSGEVTLPEREPTSRAGQLPEAPSIAPPLPPPLELAAAPVENPQPIGRETRPISIENDEETNVAGRPPDVHTRPISLDIPPARRKPADEIDALVSEWGLSEEKLARILKRSRKRMGVEATAELERLLLKPPKLPTPTKAEALAQIDTLLKRGKGRNGTSSH